MLKETKEFEAAKMNGQGQAELTREEYEGYRMKKLVLSSSVSPDTGETIPWPTRISSFVPTNVPIIVGMLCSPPTTFSTIFWQWLN